MHHASPLPVGARVLLLSNGHGEDQVGARLAHELIAARPDLRLTAFPTVGDGRAYADGPATRTGPLRTLPSAGRSVEGVAPLLADLRAGLFGTTVRQLRDLRRIRADLTVAIGDVWIQTLGTLPRSARRAAVQTLVSVRMHHGGWPSRHLLRERFTPAERLLLRAAYPQVFVRDGASARWLADREVPQARYLGNPMMDRLDASPLPWDPPGRRIVLLPGTRGHAPLALAIMLDAVARVPNVAAALPWAGTTPPAPPDGWERTPRPEGEEWRSGDARVLLVPSARFPASLRWADLAIGAAGTAHEQAAGLGLPVIAFPCGPLYTEAFLTNQRRLLGDAVGAVAADPVVVARVAEAWLGDGDERA
ncbi:MAG: lipid-A-disaccharide synthase-related protein, partial [Trueperaceae bacterium]